jgi:biotin-(acetyl-CoA carboxylase) ligase
MILERLQYPLATLVSGGGNLVQTWNELDTLAGSTVRVDVGDELIEAVAAGIDETGGLRLLHRGQIRTIHAGRVLRS